MPANFEFIRVPAVNGRELFLRRVFDRVENQRTAYRLVALNGYIAASVREAIDTLHAERDPNDPKAIY